MRLTRKEHTQAIRIALVVVTVLNLINQGDKLFHFDLMGINSLKIILTYLTPYAVSIYTVWGVPSVRKSD